MSKHKLTVHCKHSPEPFGGHHTATVSVVVDGVEYRALAHYYTRTGALGLALKSLGENIYNEHTRRRSDAEVVPS